jgi:ribosome-binding protein aMBF1 (putative translation factor)
VDRRICNVNHLFLGTHLDNMRDRTAKGRQRAPKGEESPHAKLTETQITAIRQEYAAGGISQNALGQKFGVSQHYVSDVVLGKTWAHLVHTTS